LYLLKTLSVESFLCFSIFYFFLNNNTWPYMTSSTSGPGEKK